MKDQALFEIVLAKLLGCHSEALSDADQREAILVAVAELQLSQPTAEDVHLLMVARRAMERVLRRYSAATCSGSAGNGTSTMPAGSLPCVNEKVR